MSLVRDTCSPVLDDKENAWGKVASNIPDPPKCIETCRSRFLDKIVRGFDETKYPEVCKVLLSTEGAKERLWELYCCDSTLCGVQLNGKADLNHDPNVNFVINTCQNIGSGTIQDPGPPPAGNFCPISLDYQPSLPCPRPFMMTDPRGPNPTDTNPSATPTPDFTTLTASISVITGFSTRPESSAMKTADVSASTSNQSQGHRHGGLSMGTKVAVGTSSGVALLATLAFVICLFRRRTHFEHAKKPRSEIKHPGLRQASPSTLLVSPLGFAHGGIHTVPTPPPRLQERRLLPISPDPGKPSVEIPIHWMPLDVAVTKAGPFSPPSTPSPTARTIPPRYDRSTKPYYSISPSSAFPGTSKAVKTASISSAASGRTITTVSNISSSFPHLTPSTPTRPPRPHEKPLHIQDLVCPGPPPTRSLPAPPPASPTSPVSLFRHQQRGNSSSSSSSVSAAVVNGWVPPRNPARGVVLGKESRDLCDLTETCARESRERHSRGSWAIGGGGSGLGANSVQKGDRRVNSSVLEEADLERIGGRY